MEEEDQARDAPATGEGRFWILDFRCWMEEEDQARDAPATWDFGCSMFLLGWLMHPKSNIQNSTFAVSHLLKNCHHSFDHFLRRIGLPQFQPALADFLRGHRHHLVERAPQRVGAFQ